MNKNNSFHFIKVFNDFLWPISIVCAVLLAATWAYTAYANYIDVDPTPVKTETVVLETEADTTAYILEHIDINDNGMPDDLENSTDSIYQIILDNQLAIEEISADIDRINEKLDELSESR
jgi:hypothetical protein